MPEQLAQHDGSTLRDSLRVVRRRKWVILLAVLLVPLAAVLFSLRQEARYEASAEVLLSRADLAASLTGTPGLFASEDATRFGQTQARLARVPAVAERVLGKTGLTDRTVEDFLAASDVSARQDADFLVFRVVDVDGALAMRLATEYARQFTLYRRKLDTAALVRAREEVEHRIAQLARADLRGSTLYSVLLEKEQQLQTLEALPTSNAFLVQPADGAVKVRPRPARNGFLGLALGLVLGLAAVFLWEALDTRLRSADEIGLGLGLPLLARIPEPPRRLRSTNRLAMLAEPRSFDAEQFRILRTNLDFANLERGARTIMVTSAVEGEGKSTTVANLAVAVACAGRRVVLVDLDLRHSFLDRFFDLGDRPGVTDVALGRAALEDAIVQVAIRELSGDATPPLTSAVLEVLACGPVPPDPGEFVGTRALADILERLRERADLVLIDSPPLLHVGDAMTLSARVDGLVVVTRLNVVRRRLLNELHRLLETCPAAKLGFVLTEAEIEEDYGAYGYGYAGHYFLQRADAVAQRIRAR